MKLASATAAYWIIVLCLATGAACHRGESPRSEDDQAQRAHVISPQGFAAARVCIPLDSVRALFPSARDTVVESEGVAWPGKVAAVGAGHALFEGNLEDATRVSRITVTDPGATTPLGVRVGMTVDSLVRTGEPLKMETPEGVIVLELEREGVAALIDSASQARYWSSLSDWQAEPTARDLPRGATIAALIVLGRCGGSSGVR